MITPVLPASRDRRRGMDNDRAVVSFDKSTTAWALAARAGDPAAIDRFVRALHPDVVRYVARLSSDPQAADDLAQDTFLRALGSLHRFEGRSSARVWLLSIARRAVIDSYRYAAARPRLCVTGDWRTMVERAQPSGLPGFEDGVALLDLLDALPDERREAFVLTQLLGLPTSMALDRVCCETLGRYSPVSKNRGTVSLVLVAATKRRTGRPIRQASSPALRLPKLPLGTEKTGSGRPRRCNWAAAPK